MDGVSDRGCALKISPNFVSTLEKLACGKGSILSVKTGEARSDKKNTLNTTHIGFNEKTDIGGKKISLGNNNKQVC